MRYAILAYENEADFSARTDQNRWQRYWAAWCAYNEALTAAGVNLNDAALQSGETSTTVRINRNARQVQDGPYADTRSNSVASSLSTCPILMRRWIGLRAVQ
jgi:hypothetical protein